MYDRISVHSFCFRDAGLSELVTHWHELGISRVSLYNGLVETEGLEAARQALASGLYRLETITHTFLSFGQQS